jgi:tetratricopeptide (TPR) repeat protein
LLGAVNTGKLSAAREELKTLNRLRDTLMQQKDLYKANQLAIQIKSGEAWMRLKEGAHNEALSLMQLAAEMEDSTEKHPVTPGEVIPARELLGDMLMQLHQPDASLIAYEADLRKHPNRLNALYGAGLAAEKSGNVQKAKSYFAEVVHVTGNAAASSNHIVHKSKQYLKAGSAL